MSLHEHTIAHAEIGDAIWWIDWPNDPEDEAIRNACCAAIYSNDGDMVAVIEPTTADLRVEATFTTAQEVAEAAVAWLDENRNPEGLDIPWYWRNGVCSNSDLDSLPSRRKGKSVLRGDSLLDELAQLKDKLGQLSTSVRTSVDELQGVILKCNESLNRLRQMLNDEHHLLLHMNNIPQAMEQGLIDRQVGAIDAGRADPLVESAQLHHLRSDLLGLRTEALKLRPMIHTETLAEIDDMRRETAKLQIFNQEVQQLIAQVAARLRTRGVQA